MIRHSIAALCLLLATNASAQDNGIAPLSDTELKRITPVDEGSVEMLTTKQSPKAPARAADVPLVAAPPAPAPVSAPAVVPFGVGGGAAAPSANRYSPDKVPFGRAAQPAASIPSEPHTSIATPVDDVDSIDATEPAPPTPVAIEENPAAQDPAEPTALTSPIFEEEDSIKGPRKIVIRVLNKVTAQSEQVKSAPGDLVKFGRLEISTISCRVSATNSLTDYAGLFEMNEQLPVQGAPPTKKLLFRGWMYASSPSITALEHPIYDVTMVSCEPATPAPKADDKSAKKVDKKAKK